LIASVTSIFVPPSNASLSVLLILPEGALPDDAHPTTVKTTTAHHIGKALMKSPFYA
jgi:hypothetical protein